MAYRELFGDAYVHVCNRGSKGLPIYRKKEDLWRLLANLFYLNHQGPMPENWSRTLAHLGLWTPGVYTWPKEWEPRVPLVSVLAFCIMSNHFHLILKEQEEKGIPKFMHRVSMAYSKFINEKYDESGSLFQGAYKARLLLDDNYLRYAAVYVLVKNTFELEPAGLRSAIKNFDRAYKRASVYPFASLGTYSGGHSSAIVEKDILGKAFETSKSFKEFAHECMLHKLELVSSSEL